MSEVKIQLFSDLPTTTTILIVTMLFKKTTKLFKTKFNICDSSRSQCSVVVEEIFQVKLISFE